MRSAFCLLLSALFVTLPSRAVQAQESRGSADSDDQQRSQDLRSQDNRSQAVSLPRYITGGVVGSVAGFGIGHGIVGRYREIGWKFTAGETGGLILMLIGAANLSDCDDCDDGDDFDDFDSHRRPRGISPYGRLNAEGAGLFWVGFFTVVGFHVWEVIDIWTNTPHGRGSDAWTDKPLDKGGLKLGLGLVETSRPSPSARSASLGDGILPTFSANYRF